MVKGELWQDLCLWTGHSERGVCVEQEGISSAFVYARQGFVVSDKNTSAKFIVQFWGGFVFFFCYLRVFSLEMLYSPPKYRVRAFVLWFVREGKWWPAWIVGICLSTRTEMIPVLLTTAFT